MAGTPAVEAIGPSYRLADRQISSQRSINWALRTINSLGESKKVVLAPTAGLATLHDFGAPVRGAITARGREFVVAGNQLYEWAAGAAVPLGTLSSDAGFISVREGRDQLVFAAGTDGYVFKFATSTLGLITDPDWRGSRWVEELNGSFIFVPDDQPDQFYISSIDDGSQFDGLDFSSSDAQPDDIVTHRVLLSELYLFNQYSTEVWIYAADLDFPLTRYNSTPIDVGCVGLRAAILAANTLVFVGRTRRGTGVVYLMSGHQPVRISTDAVEESLQAPGVDLENCTMWVRQGVGSERVGINAPGLPTTWVWDAVTREWHEEAELVDGEWGPSRVDQVLCAPNGEHHATAGTKLYRVVEDSLTIDGVPVGAERTWPHLAQPAMEPVTYAGLQLSCTTGGNGTITLECSNDGGYVFGPPLLRYLGATGQRMASVRWLWLGSSMDRVFRLRCTDANVPTLYRANVEYG